MKTIIKKMDENSASGKFVKEKPKFDMEKELGIKRVM